MKLKRNLKLIRIFILSLFVSGNLFAASIIETIFKEKSEIKDPMSLRDPFLSPKIKSKKRIRVANKIGKGMYSNVPVIGTVKLENLRIIGVVIGANRRAFVKLTQGGNTLSLQKIE